MMSHVDKIRADLHALIDVNNDVENCTPHASSEWRKAQTRGNALRKALKALEDYSE